MSNPSTQYFIRNLNADINEVKRELDKFYRYQHEEREKVARNWAIKHGWYDWFCKETALIGRTAKYGSQIRSIVNAVPILGKNTIVGFSQSYGDGYNDSYYIQNPNGTFGYGISINYSPDIPYYVYRINRGYDSDYNAKSFNEVLNFIKKDVLIWLTGGKTREYKRVGWMEPMGGYTQSRIKATKPYMVVPGSPVGDMVLQYRAKNRKKAKKKTADSISKKEFVR